MNERNSQGWPWEPDFKSFVGCWKRFDESVEECRARTDAAHRASIARRVAEQPTPEERAASIARWEARR